LYRSEFNVHLSFNPRTREGCDIGRALYQAMPQEFQSTHPRGVRLDTTTSAGDMTLVSIHAPARGATVIKLYRAS